MVAISTHLKLAFAWITYTNTLSVDKMRPLMSDNFISRLRPASLGYEPVGKEPYLVRLAGAPIKNFNISLPRTEDIVEGKDAIQFYTTADGKTSHGFRWKNEYQFSFTFEGDKILSVTEFTDPTIIVDLLGKEATAAEAELNCKGQA
ncbi:hypothetical protein BDZ94DRAFT_1305835 [Collybia nuda]|uniref:SnoaL-like domain-containing protein n=1 Tax=Collybia nuda TaxID=64659 RepID=A0A9P6CHY5_9AGAR|nr:hypothetical protein BDZ94DRAFT_1305835 [Collybia nuda]